MTEFRRLGIALLVLALLTPVGLYLPDLMRAGAAWGEWGVEEVKALVGYAPAGMERSAGRWRAPMPAYAPPGGREDSPARRGAAYVLSGLAGAALCGGAAWLVARRLSSGKSKEGKT